jgi:hypothetical protein
MRENPLAIPAARPERIVEGNATFGESQLSHLN